MKKTVYSLILAFIFAACGSSKKTPVATTPVAKEKASWMLNPPQDPNYYTGIGMVDKTIEPSNYIASAKKRALQDLASSIKIKISSNSVLHQLEQTSNYNENYTSTIKSSSNIDLEGFELIDTWEDGREYWAYYRLSKSVHKEAQEKKKRLATEKALNHYNLAKQYNESNNIDLALKNYLDGLFALKEYLGEQILIDNNGNKEDLNSLLYQNLQSCLSSIQLSTASKPVNYKISSNQPLSIPLSIENTKGTLANLFIQSTYLADDQFGNSTKKTTSIKSSIDGICKFSLQDISNKTRSQNIKFELLISEIPVMEKDEEIKKILYTTLIQPEAIIPVNIIMPKVFISTNEKNMSATITNPSITNYISNGLNKEGIEVVSSSSKADYTIEVYSNTEESGETNGVYNAQLSSSIKVKNKSGNYIYQKSVNGIYGSQLTYKKAGIEAYKNAESEIKFKVLKRLINEIL